MLFLTLIQVMKIFDSTQNLSNSVPFAIICSNLFGFNLVHYIKQMLKAVQKLSELCFKGTIYTVPVSTLPVDPLNKDIIQTKME
jgi:hypothetical protein